MNDIPVLNIVIAIIASGVLLFLWTGLTQNLIPWGIKSVRAHDQKDGTGAALAKLTTDGMVFITDQVAAFIAIKPAAYYVTGRYFAIEFVTQIIVGAVLTGLLVLTAPLDDGTRLLIVGLAGAAGVASIDLQYWNWWGFSNRYTLGVAVNRLAGYLLITLILLAVLL